MLFLIGNRGWDRANGAWETANLVGKVDRGENILFLLKETRGGIKPPLSVNLYRGGDAAIRKRKAGKSRRCLGPFRGRWIEILFLRKLVVRHGDAVARETATCMGGEQRCCFSGNLRWDRAAVAWKIQLTGGIKLQFKKIP